MKHQTLLFDLDDTLIHCNKYFIQVIDQFAEQMKQWFVSFGIPKTQFISKQLELDIVGVKKFGFVPHRFPASLVETYEYFCNRLGRQQNIDEKKQLTELGYSVYEFENAPYPHMEETLDQLATQGHELCLYTGGDPEIQHAKIKRLRLETFFGERIYIARHKTSAAMEQLISKLGVDRTSTWMIGNSVTTDIIPALKARLHAIFIPAEKEWDFNKGEVNIIPEGTYLELTSLREVPEAITQYTSPG